MDGEGSLGAVQAIMGGAESMAIAVRFLVFTNFERGRSEVGTGVEMTVIGRKLIDSVS